MASRARQATMIAWRRRRLLHSVIRDITREESFKLFQEPVAGKDCKGIFHWPYFYAILLFFAKALHLGKSFSVLFITDLNTALLVERSLTRRHIVYLICFSNARVLTKSVKIDQSEGIPDPGIPERLFVKFSHRRSLASSRRASPPSFIWCLIEDTGMSIYGIWSHPSPRPRFPFSSAAISLLRFCRVFGMFIFFPVCCDYFIAWSFLVFYLVEYSGEHDISLLTSQANADVEKMFCGLNWIVET